MLRARPGPALAGLPDRRAALVALLLFTQALALVHLGTVAHAIDPTTGKVVHASNDHRNRHLTELPNSLPTDLPDEAPAQPSPWSPPDECAIYSAFTQAATSPSPAANLPQFPPAGTGHVLPRVHPHRAWRPELHRLSPSHSPPAAT